MGFLVAAAGAALGGYVGGLLNPQPKTPAPDTSIPGIKSATLQAPVKGQGGIQVAQVDPTQSINYFKSAAQQANNTYSTGLGLYNESMAGAVSAINNSVSTANQGLQTLSQTGFNALNEQLRYLGLNPISRTASSATQIMSIGNFSDLSSQIQQAENLTNASDRAAAKQQVLNSVQQKIASLTNSGQLPALEQAQELQQFADNYSASYDTSAYQGAYTPEQVQAKLSQTPGYQFQLDQGTQAIARQASAMGNLISGNTATALQTYGQGLADQYFQQNMQSLQNISNQTLPAATNLAANEVNQGKDVANIYSLIGSATASTYGAEASNTYNYLTNAGSTSFNAAQFNANAQNQALAQYRGAQYNSQQAAISAGPAYMNAATNAAQVNYGIFQNQQAGQAFYNNLQQPNSGVYY